jgi:hypothetical protein
MSIRDNSYKWHLRINNKNFLIFIGKYNITFIQRNLQREYFDDSHLELFRCEFSKQEYS